MTRGSASNAVRRGTWAASGVVCLLLACASVGTAASAVGAARGDRQAKVHSPAAATNIDWPAYQHGPAHSNAAYGDTAITTANAASLTAKWTFVSKPSTVAGAPKPRFDSSATVVAGMVYITSRNGQVYALNATTGALVWQKSIDFGSSTDCVPNGPTGTPAVVADPVTGASTLYVPGSHYLYAFNPTTGAQLWKAAMGPATAAGEARWYDWSSPLVVGGKITVGMTSACADLIRGGVIQFDQHTGKKLHTWYAVPAGKVGTSVWTSQAGDGTNVWVTTGNPDPNAGQVYDAFSIVRLSASTLTKVDKWTTPTPITDDLDFGGSPAFVSAMINGVVTPMVGACNKNGIFYMFNRNNLAAGPIWQRQVGEVGGTLQGACITSPAFDSAQNAIWVAGNQTTINGVSAQGSIRKLDPATGAIEWEQPLGCIPDGSPTINATTHVLAVPLYRCVNGAKPGMELFDSVSGTPLRTFTTPDGVFAQGVFAEGKLFIADEQGNLTAWGP